MRTSTRTRPLHLSRMPVTRRCLAGRHKRLAPMVMHADRTTRRMALGRRTRNRRSRMTNWRRTGIHKRVSYINAYTHPSLCLPTNNGSHSSDNKYHQFKGLFHTLYTLMKRTRLAVLCSLIERFPVFPLKKSRGAGRNRTLHWENSNPVLHYSMVN